MGVRFGENLVTYTLLALFIAGMVGPPLLHARRMKKKEAEGGE